MSFSADNDALLLQHLNCLSCKNRITSLETFPGYTKLLLESTFSLLHKKNSGRKCLDSYFSLQLLLGREDTALFKEHKQSIKTFWCLIRVIGKIVSTDLRIMSAGEKSQTWVLTFFIVVPCILITSRFLSPTNAIFY